MTRTLLVSRRPVEGLSLAARLAGSGDTVTVVLLDAAASIARPGHEDGVSIADAARAGVTVLAHDEALQRRSVREPTEHVKVVDLDAVADAVIEGADWVVWT
jgi:hypothetical protein